MFFFFQAEDGIRDAQESRGLGDVYKRQLYAWYSFTDTSIFTDSSNRGYSDKGIGVRIPMRLFEGTDTKTAYNYSVSPWTRDVAQDIDHFTNLFDYLGRDTKIYLDKDRNHLYK